LQDGLLDEPIHAGGNPEFSDSTVGFRYLLPLHRAGLVRSCEQLLPQARPVFRQVLAQLVHGHPVDARAPFVPPCSLQRLLDVATFHHLFHQVVAS
jgi:hypothetical protein